MYHGTCILPSKCPHTLVNSRQKTGDLYTKKSFGIHCTQEPHGSGWVLVREGLLNRATHSDPETHQHVKDLLFSGRLVLEEQLKYVTLGPLAEVTDSGAVRSKCIYRSQRRG